MTSGTPPGDYEQSKQTPLNCLFSFFLVAVFAPSQCQVANPFHNRESNKSRMILEEKYRE